ncbi:hypothetical protein [Pseudoclavibacter sp. RFBA6]|uniref:hypothetical protein n=1 Tax=Pseudoclavibacter sp. RFBA6 TaxID=2080573 RepID=UPI000CE724D3|nr:hypothetical protein [Pseudoclavibacter sp. RFBA6]PPG43728.1 hypothetical protein C5C17_00390 [Pseudoclavibacter sp. RFBA6]
MSELEEGYLEESMQDAMVYGQQRCDELSRGDYRVAMADRLSAVRSLTDTAKAVATGPLLNEGELRSRMSAAMLAASTWEGLDAGVDRAVDVIDGGLRDRYSGQLDPSRTAPTIESVRGTMEGNHEVYTAAYFDARERLASAERQMQAAFAGVAVDTSRDATAPALEREGEAPPLGSVTEARAAIEALPSLRGELVFGDAALVEGPTGPSMQVHVLPDLPFEPDVPATGVTFSVDASDAERGSIKTLVPRDDGSLHHVFGDVPSRLNISDADTKRMVDLLQPALASEFAQRTATNAGHGADRAASMTEPANARGGVEGPARDETLDRITRLRQANFAHGSGSAPAAQVPPTEAAGLRHGLSTHAPSVER